MALEALSVRGACLMGARVEGMIVVGNGVLAVFVLADLDFRCQVVQSLLQDVVLVVRMLLLLVFFGGLCDGWFLGLWLFFFLLLHDDDCVIGLL